MSIKTILVPVSNLSQARSAVETAFLVARPFDGHVVGLHVRPTFNEDKIEAVMKLASLGKSSPLLREAGDAPVFAEDEDTQAARQLFEDVRKAMRVESGDRPCDPSGLSAAFKMIDGDGPEAIAEQARVFDLVVVSQPKSDPDHRLREILRAVLFYSGRPILSVPERTPASVGETILVAWSGSALSARAAAIGRVYFEYAKKVGILSVAAEQGHGPLAEELVEHFAWHDIDAALIETELGHRRLGDVILDQAAAFGADLLVMGAYSQSPFRESLTRGVTNYILSHAELPVLMTH
ncbi:MAG: universal stress protein [Alphaproteobacteria bacterium]|nr:universal stress protein [Alphaproteobacteria bacterium]